MTEDPFAIPFVQSGPFPMRPGHVVRPLIDGIPAFRRICAAIDAATQRLWVTVTFLWPTFAMPDGRGGALDVLDRAAARGVDVRVLFWRPDGATDGWKTNAFWGSPEQIRLLETRTSGVKIRWDRAAPGYCQHQKSWLVDDGPEAEIAFVGGINLNPHSMVAPGHPGGGGNHDVYAEIIGPATVDVRRNFVERWNGASERHGENGRWGSGSEIDLPLPTQVPRPCGSARVQIQRTMPGAERAIFDQYCVAIDAARRSIYIENQYVTVLEIVARLHHALQRGVEVVLLLPAEPDSLARYVTDDHAAFFQAWAALGGFENFTLAGLAGLTADNRRAPVYVHAKLMLADDCWATVGSANLHAFSLFGNSEMNAAFSDPETVRRSRCELFQEHLAEDTSSLDDRAALRRFRQVALQNRTRRLSGDPAWQGQAFALEATGYGR